MVPRYLVIHCTGGKPWASVEDIRRYHEDHLGWSDIGYHFVVSPDGTVRAGRPIHKPGSHVRGMNHESIGLVWTGTFDDEPPTQAAWDAMVELCAALCRTYGIDATHVIGHWEAQVIVDGKATKTCPGKAVDMDRFRSDVASHRSYRGAP